MYDTCVSLQSHYAEMDQLRAKLPKDVSILSDDPVWLTNKHKQEKITLGKESQLKDIAAIGRTFIYLTAELLSATQ